MDVHDGSDPERIDRQRRSRQTAQHFAELAGARTAADRRELCERIVLLNTGVAGNIARRFHGRGLDAEDVDQTAYAALVRSVQGFRPELGHDFLEYAVPTIRGEIKRYFRDHGWVVRVPRRVQDTQREVDAVEPTLDGLARCSDAMIDDLARRIGRPRRDVADALSARGCFAPTSLDLPVSTQEGSATLGDHLPDVHDRWVTRVEDRVMLTPLVSDLPPRDRLIVRLRYVEELTQKRIAEELGVSQVQVYRLLTRIHRQLHRELVGAGGRSVGDVGPGPGEGDEPPNPGPNGPDQPPPDNPSGALSTARG